MKRTDVFKGSLLKSVDIGTREVRVTIESGSMEEVGQERESRFVLRFAGKDQGMVVNKTNWERLEESFGEDSEDWVGCEVVVYTERTTFQGRRVDGLRLRPLEKQSTAAAEPAALDASGDPVAADSFADDIPF